MVTLRKYSDLESLGSNVDGIDQAEHPEIVEDIFQRVRFRYHLLQLSGQFSNLTARKSGFTNESYIRVLPAYTWPLETTDKRMSLYRNLNIGHKLHLNPHPDHTTMIAEYLKDHHYDHKYLTNGDPEDGKVFTIYTGYKDLTDKLAVQLSTDLHEYLFPETPCDEFEYAPKISGRFSHLAPRFYNYGTWIKGIPILTKDIKGLRRRINVAKSQKEILDILSPIFDGSFNWLSDRHGTYFYGSTPL